LSRSGSAGARRGVGSGSSAGAPTATSNRFTTRIIPFATFLGRKLSTQYEGEVGNRFNIRIEGTRIKDIMGPVSLKLYDKFGLILRIETTVNDLTFFKHYREVEHRDGSKETKWASLGGEWTSVIKIQEASARKPSEAIGKLPEPGRRYCR